MVLSNSSSPHSSSSSPPSTSSLNLTNISNYQHDPLMSDVVSSSEEAGKCINNQNGQLDNKDESPSVSKANIHQSSTSIDSFIQPNQLSKPNSIRQYSRNHQRRFHRRFPSIDPEEKLIDWYNCALVAEILLQGYLYISENYFAFYSNILGYKTQLLVSLSDVKSVTKEKTARIFPNAVGISTEQNKYVFGSLLSRESTFKLMQEVWKSTLIQVVSRPYLSTTVEEDINCVNICDQVNSENTLSSNDNASNQTQTANPMIFKYITKELKVAPDPITHASSSSQETETSESENDNQSEKKNDCLCKRYPYLHVSKLLDLRWLGRVKNFLPSKSDFKLALIYLPGSTFMLAFVTLFLTILLMLSFFLLYRIDEANHKLTSMHQFDQIVMYSKAQSRHAYLQEEIKKLLTLLEDKANDLTTIKQELQLITNSRNPSDECSHT